MPRIRIRRNAVAGIAFLALIGCSDSPTAIDDGLSERRANVALLGSGVPSDGRVPAVLSSDAVGSSALVQIDAFNTVVIGEPADGSNFFPFGGSAFGAANRYQQAYAAGRFNSSTPLLIRSITFLGGQGALATNSYAFFLSTITAGIDNLSTTNFNANRGADNTLLATLNLSGAAPATLTIEGATPFLYDPSAGNLLLDIVITPGGVIGGALPSFYLARNGTASGIMSRYHNFGTGFIGWGLVTRFELAPLTLDNVVAVVNQAVASGALTGDGNGESGAQRLKAWMNMLQAAQQSSASGNVGGACAVLEQAYLRSDGTTPPPDFVRGSAAQSIAKLLQALRTEFGCR